jgi:hypothetical protein
VKAGLSRHDCGIGNDNRLNHMPRVTTFRSRDKTLQLATSRLTLRGTRA